MQKEQSGKPPKTRRIFEPELNKLVFPRKKGTERAFQAGDHQ